MAKILIVDDDDVIAEAYSIILKAEGFEVSRAFDGKSGLEEAIKGQPDVILLDVLMPYIGGIEFLEAYDAKNKHADVSIIVLTNSQVPHDTEDRVRELGAKEYLLKAKVTPKHLLEIINYYLPADSKK